MPPTASAIIPDTIEQEDDAPSHPDLSAAAGIMAAVTMSAVFWVAIGYAVDAVLG